MQIRRRLSMVLAAVAMIAAAVVANPATAGAATAGTCTGSITAYKQLRTGAGVVVGEIVVYYKSLNGGTNTACLYHRGPAYNVSAPTMVQLGECFARNCTYAFDGGYFMKNEGNFTHYAGPVRRQTTDANCVIAEGHIVWRGQYVIGSTGPVGCP